MKPPRKAMIAAILLAAGTVLAQDQPKQPMSPYMRKTGLLYLDQLDDFEQRCKKACDTVFNSEMKKTMDSLEDNIAIDLDEPGRPAGDTPYFALLKSVRQAEYKYLGAIEYLQIIQRSDQTRREAIAEGLDAKDYPATPEAGRVFAAEGRSRWNNTYVACYSLTRDMAKTGSYLPSVAENCRNMILKSEGEDTNFIKQTCQSAGATWENGQCTGKPRPSARP